MSSKMRSKVGRNSVELFQNLLYILFIKCIYNGKVLYKKFIQSLGQEAVTIRVFSSCNVDRVFIRLIVNKGEMHMGIFCYKSSIILLYSSSSSSESWMLVLLREKLTPLPPSLPPPPPPIPPTFSSISIS